MLEKTKWRRKIQAKAIADAQEVYKKCSGEKEADSVAARLLQICREQKNVADMKIQAEGTESDKKRELTKPLVERIEKAVKMEKEYSSKSRIEPSEQFCDEEIYSLYSRIFLEQLKYLLRPGREERRANHE